MDREYEIFECLPDGSVMWRGRASGLQAARLKLENLVRITGKEYFGMHLLTRDVVFAADASNVVNVRSAKRVFQIAYTDELRSERAELLRSLGYGVISVVGNEAAKTLLATLSRIYDLTLFVIGHAAPAQSRKEMVVWLKANYPTVKVLALNPPNEQLSDADYNVQKNGPETWLPLAAGAMNRSASQ